MFVEFGQKYKARTDANGAIMIAYIGIFTLVILVGTVISPIQWEFTDICFVVIMQIYLLFLMGGFAVALAFEGDRHTEVGERSQVILAAMAIQLEKERWMHAKSITREKEYAYESARFSISQLQVCLYPNPNLPSFAAFLYRCTLRGRPCRKKLLSYTNPNPNPSHH